MPHIERVPVGDIEIAYETFGDRSDPAVVLIMGLGTQMLAWPDEFCGRLADSGRYVVRFDNRDCGLSTHLDSLAAPRPGPCPASPGDGAVLDRGHGGRHDSDCWTLSGWTTVDLVGASMGGFIAQAVALARPDRLRSLTLMMTSTGSRRVGYPSPKVARRLLRRRSVGGRDAAIAMAVSVFRLIGSPGYAFDEEYLQRLAGRSYDRAYDPKGYLRQLAACLVQRDRTPRLRELRVPTLVMHGLHDPLVSPSGGLSLARTIPGSRFVGYSGMGHDLPRELLAEIASEIVRLGDGTALVSPDR